MIEEKEYSLLKEKRYHEFKKNWVLDKVVFEDSYETKLPAVRVSVKYFPKIKILMATLTSYRIKDFKEQDRPRREEFLVHQDLYVILHREAIKKYSLKKVEDLFERLKPLFTEERVKRLLDHVSNKGFTKDPEDLAIVREIRECLKIN